MRNHKVTVDDFLGVFHRARLCCQHDRGKIDVLTDPVGKRMWYECSNNRDVVVYTGTDLAEAIKYYNEA